MSYNFKECVECESKPGHPYLCADCLDRRARAEMGEEISSSLPLRALRYIKAGEMLTTADLQGTLDMTKFDEINKAAHYNQSDAKCSNCWHPIECIDVVKHYDFLIGNVIKYAWRAGLKGDALSCLKKARYYLDKAIERLKKDGK